MATADGSRVQPTGRPLTAKDYDVIVFAGDRETNDVRAIRREVALRVLPALRDAEADLHNWRRSPMRNLLERLPLDPVNLEATASAMATAVDQLTKDDNVAKLEGHLTERLGAMFGPRLAVQPTLGFASSKPDELIRAVRLFFDTARRRSISDTSLGSANVIYLGLLLEALSQQRDDEEFIATLVAVEEPEAHLHVTLQRHLFGYLLRSGPSLVLTTHSPHIAAVAPVRSFIVLRATENGTTGATTSALPVSSEQAADLERYLDVSRAEVLFASAVVLVEGLAELYVLPALAEAVGFDLDAYGTVVASVHGTDFKPYRALLGPKGLDTPTWSSPMETPPATSAADGKPASSAARTSTPTKHAARRYGTRLPACRKPARPTTKRPAVPSPQNSRTTASTSAPRPWRPTCAPCSARRSSRPSRS